MSKRARQMYERGETAGARLGVGASGETSALPPLWPQHGGELLLLKRLKSTHHVASED